MFTSWERVFDGDLILPNLYLGSACGDRSALKTKKVTHIVTVSNEFPPAFTDEFNYMVIHISDEYKSNLIQAFEECAQFIDEGRSNGNVFVHCAAGISRSTTVVVAYLLLRSYSKTPEEALQFIRQSRSFVAPNGGFWNQLKVFHEASFDLSHSSVTRLLPTIASKPRIERFIVGNQIPLTEYDNDDIEIVKKEHQKMHSNKKSEN